MLVLVTLGVTFLVSGPKLPYSEVGEFSFKDEECNNSSAFWKGIKVIPILHQFNTLCSRHDSFGK